MFHYFILYKPYEVLSQFSKEGNKETLKDYCQVANDVYPVGRLDYDSEGLLFLTNDKSMNALLLHPSRQHQRSYLVQVEGLVTKEALRLWEAGVEINVNGSPYQTKPAKARLLNTEPLLPDRHPPIRFRKNIPTSWIELSLTEGKNRQVRRMTAKLGFPTLRLVRYQIGRITADGWASGELRSYTKKEIEQMLFK